MTHKILRATPARVGLVAAACLISVLCLAAPAARRWASRSHAAAPEAPRPPQGNYRQSAIVFTLSPTGFYPAEVTLRRGRYLLAVENRTGLLGEVELRLEREHGGRLKEGRVPKGKRAWKEVVELPPGRYVLTEAGHPEWVGYVNIID